jgi:hypothetical protein
MIVKNIRAAAMRTFLSCGNEEYAENKTIIFLHRCGADMNKPNQEIPDDVVKQICYAMLDENSEQIFWSSMRYLWAKE